jgi:hypothetical protein
VLDDDVQDVPSSEKRNGLGGGGHSQIMGNAIGLKAQLLAQLLPMKIQARTFLNDCPIFGNRAAVLEDLMD